MRAPLLKTQTRFSQLFSYSGGGVIKIWLDAIKRDLAPKQATFRITSSLRRIPIPEALVVIGYPADTSLIYAVDSVVSLLTLIHWIPIYPVENVILPSSNWGQGFFKNERLIWDLNYKLLFKVKEISSATIFFSPNKMDSTEFSALKLWLILICFRFEKLAIPSLKSSIEERYACLLHHFGKEVEVISKVN